jgi:hypothetical protein
VAPAQPDVLPGPDLAPARTDVLPGPDLAPAKTDVLPGPDTIVTPSDTGPGIPDAVPPRDGLGADALAGDAQPPYTGAGQTWTILVYMVADNNLEPFGLGDLTEMMDIGSNASFHMLAQVDRSAAYTSASIGGIANWTGVKRLRVDRSALVQLQDLGNIDMGLPSTLAAFLDWGIKTAPADRYALILWDHGGSWQIFGPDESNAENGLTITEIRQGVVDGLQASGLGRPLDILGFDACLMANYEVATSLQPVARYLIASEETEPGHGWDYRALELARDTPTSKPLELGTAIVNGYLAQAREEGDDETITLSLSDLGEVAGLQSAVAALATAINGNLSGYAQTLGTVRANSPPFEASTGMIDLGRFATDLAAAEPKLATAQAGVSTALGKVIRTKVAGAAQSKTTGLSIYFPETSRAYRTDYGTLPGVTEWSSFLTSYYATGQSIAVGSQPQVVSELGTISAANGQLVLVGQLKPGTWANISSVTLNFGVVLDSDFVLLGDTPGVLDGSGAIGGSWDATILKLEQGTTWDYGYLSVSEDASGLIVVDIPLSYTEKPGAVAQEIIYEIVINANTSQVASETYYAQVGGAYGELVPLAGSTLSTLLLMVSGASGDVVWVPGTEVFDGTLPLTISLEPLPSGTQVFMMVTAEDFGANSASVIGTGVL